MLKTEYKRSFKLIPKNVNGNEKFINDVSTLFKKSKRKQKDYLKLEGSLVFNPEYREVYIEFPRQRPVIKRPLDLSLIHI